MSIKDPVSKALVIAGRSRMSSTKHQRLAFCKLRQLPVRFEYTEAVAYYMETGEIKSYGGLVTEKYKDIIHELLVFKRDPTPKEMNRWETRLPSTLTIIQSDSAGLNAKGLPCCHDTESTIGTFFASDNKLVALNTGVEPIKNAPKTVENDLGVEKVK